MSQVAEALRQRHAGRLHPLAGAVWVAAPALVTPALALAIYHVPAGSGTFTKLLACLPAMLIFWAADERWVGYVLPAPSALSHWLTRALASNLILDSIGPALHKHHPRGQHWRQIKIGHIAGIWVLIAIAAATAWGLKSFVPLYGLIIAITLLRIWYLQHFVNWWTTLRPELDRMQAGAFVWEDPMLRRSLVDSWEREQREHFNLLNPWAWRGPSDPIT